MTETKTIFQAKILAEIVVFSALSAVLYALRPFSLPYGGPVTPGSMVPIIWLSMRRGVYVGFVAGAIFGVLSLFIDVILLPFSPIATPLQVVLEYPVACGVLGLSGVFHRKTVAFAVVGTGFSIFIKFLIHYFVGVFVWFYVYEFPIEWGQYLWPAVYNGSFLLVEFVISSFLIAVLVKKRTLEYAL